MKVLFITDSVGLPRVFPEIEIVNLEETYAQLVKKKLNKDNFHQISLAGDLSDKIIDHARSYFVNWKPDYIVVGLGVNDARPISLNIILQDYFLFSKLLKFKSFQLLVSWIGSNFFKKPISITNLDEFSKKLEQLKNSFKSSKILWLEITCGKDYEISRPGVLELVEKFNKKLLDTYNDDFIKLKEAFKDEKVYNSDNLHLNKNGHKIISKEICKKLGLN